jgi:hypothetical protein
MIIREQTEYADLTDEELQEGINGLNDVLDELINYKSRIEDADYSISKFEADEISDKLFDICDVVYLSDEIDHIAVILNNLGKYNTDTRYVVKIIDKIMDVVVKVLRDLEEEQRYRF